MLRVANIPGDWMAINQTAVTQLGEAQSVSVCMHGGVCTANSRRDSYNAPMFHVLCHVLCKAVNQRLVQFAPTMVVGRNSLELSFRQS